MKRTKWIVGIAGTVMALMLSATSMTALAAEAGTDAPAEAGNYSYLAGQ